MITTPKPSQRTLPTVLPLPASLTINISTYCNHAKCPLKTTSAAVALLLSVGQAHAQDTKSVANAQTALFATVCIMTTAHGGLCKEFQLTPGVAGQLFSSVQACDAGAKAAMEKWFKDVRPTLGITEKNVFAQRCGPPEVAVNPEREARVERRLTAG